MSLKDIRKLKIDKTKKQDIIEVDYCIIGENNFSIMAYYNLKDQSSCLIVKEKLSINDIMINGPTSIRGNSNIDAIKQLLGEDIDQKKINSSFFKEKKFKRFGGRSKSEKLLRGEEFYSLPGIKLPQNIIKQYCNDTYFQYAESNSHISDIFSIESIEDENSNIIWTLQLSNGKIINCKKLIWGRTPWSFLT